MTAASALAILFAAQADPFAPVLEKLRETAGRAVVSIEVERTEDPEGRLGAGAVAQHRDYYNRPKGPTSAVIWSADGHLLTSRFNISGTLRKGSLRATLWDGRELEARLVGWDELRDIALLKVEAGELPVLPRADLSKLGQGSFLALLGRSPEKDRATVNLGILSALDRFEKTCLQTDAEMNYGNAGGPLVTLRGEFVGLACHIRPDTSWGQSGGVGFACKAAEIDAILPRLKAGEQIAAPKKPFLGVRPGEGDPAIEGFQVGEVVPGSPAEKAGIVKDDVIVELGGEKISDFESFSEALAEKKIGDTVVVKVKRKRKDGIQDKEFKIVLEGRAQP